MKDSKTRTISQPASWWDAVEGLAARRGLTVSEWVGRAILRYLPPDVRRSLPPRTPPGRVPVLGADPPRHRGGRKIPKKRKKTSV